MSSSSCTVVGIDLGTTNSCIAVLLNGKVDVIANDFGKRTTPSVVAFQEGDDTELVGDAAVSQAGRNPTNTIWDVKRVIGRSWNEVYVQEDIKHWPFEVFNERGNPVFRVQHQGVEKVYQPQEVSAMVLYKLKTIAEAYLGKRVTHAVITVPAYFNESQKRATKEAGERAGLRVLRLMPEPSAAALAYSMERLGTVNKIVLIYDLGGGTFDVSIASVAGRTINVIGIEGNTHLGGVDFDQRILKHVVQEITRTMGEDVVMGNARKMHRLWSLCERAKRDLSAMVRTEIDVAAVVGDECTLQLSRARMEDLCKDLLARTIETVKSLLRNSKLHPEDIDEVILVGGSTRMPCVQRALQDLFPGKDICKTVNPDEAVAHGAALLAAHLSKENTVSGLGNPGRLVTDVTPLSIGLDERDGLFKVVIPRNTPIPARRHLCLFTTLNNQSCMYLPVLQGERLVTTRNQLIGEYILDGIPPAPAGLAVDVVLSVDEDGLLTVRAKAVNSSEWRGCTFRLEARTSVDVLQLMEDAEKCRQEDEREVMRVRTRYDLVTFIINENAKVAHNPAKLKIFQELKMWHANNKDASTEEFRAMLARLQYVMLCHDDQLGERSQSEKRVASNFSVHPAKRRV